MAKHTYHSPFETPIGQLLLSGDEVRFINVFNNNLANVKPGFIGIDLNQKCFLENNGYVDFLHYAISEKYSYVVDKLLPKLISLKINTELNGITLLDTAAITGNEKIFKQVLDFNKKNGYSNTKIIKTLEISLFFAVSAERENIVKILLDNGARGNIKYKKCSGNENFDSNMTVVEYATSVKSLDTASLIRAHQELPVLRIYCLKTEESNIGKFLPEDVTNLISNYFVDLLKIETQTEVIGDNQADH